MARPSEAIAKDEEVLDGNDTVFPVCLTRQNSVRSSTNYRRNVHRASFHRRRLIDKNGIANVFICTVKSYWDRYWRDVSNTLINSKWRWTFISLTACFILSWATFASAWMLISRYNGDDNKENPPQYPCLSGIESFGGFMMFSIETQQTIGYGTRFIHNDCPEGTFIMCMQMILGGAICGAMVSLVNAKMVRPYVQQATGLFSKRAVICMRDGVLCLIFRVQDDNGRHAAGTKINAYLVVRRKAEPFLKTLELEPYGLLIWPLEVVHRITPDSPFYDLSAEDLISKSLEIIVILEGTSIITGQSSKTQASYINKEILWGSRFKSCVTFDHGAQSYYVHNEHFDETVDVTTPLCSMKRFVEVIDDIITTKGVQENGLLHIIDDEEDEDNVSIYDSLEMHQQIGVPCEEEVVMRRVNDGNRYSIDVESLIDTLQRAVSGRSIWRRPSCEETDF